MVQVNCQAFDDEGTVGIFRERHAYFASPMALASSSSSVLPRADNETTFPDRSIKMAVGTEFTP